MTGCIRASLGTGKPLVYENQLSVIPGTLILQLAQDLAHARLVHAPAKTTTERLRHGMEHQGFDHDGVMAAHQVGGELVNAIVPGKEDL